MLIMSSSSVRCDCCGHPDTGSSGFHRIVWKWYGITTCTRVYNTTFGKRNAIHCTACTPKLPAPCTPDDATMQPYKHAIVPGKRRRPMTLSLHTLQTGRLIGQRRRHYNLPGPAGWLPQTRCTVRDALIKKGQVESQREVGEYLWCFSRNQPPRGCRIGTPLT